MICGALDDQEIEALLAAGAEWDGRRSSDFSGLCDALAHRACDIAYDENHSALYLHRDGFLQGRMPVIVRKLLHAMRTPLGEQGEPAGTELQVRCIELHQYSVGGGLLTPGHRDNGSALTMSVMLSRSNELEGGQFVTYEEGMPVAHTLARGDALLFRSEKLHNVSSVLRGLRKSLVIELWRHPTNTTDRFK